jgi:hypothetical protein
VQQFLQLLWRMLLLLLCPLLLMNMLLLVCQLARLVCSVLVAELLQPSAPFCCPGLVQAEAGRMPHC